MSEARELLKEAMLLIGRTHNSMERPKLSELADCHQKIEAYLAKPLPEPIGYVKPESLEAIVDKVIGISKNQINEYSAPIYSELPERKSLTTDCETMTGIELPSNENARLKNLLADIKQFDIQNYVLDLRHDIRARIERALDGWGD